ncbi:hypothetical protein QTP70_002286 [Hemibagrus guttatus]|uniref:Tc1-like transposase DDE domain-containing protein n=1 Tax=Hemibagrus guttatus TaxID=175788 RepID=A0AAE0UP02_9TELE|nr:hypothetical protein QTP70_002286 [Hemibagrus guttatus]
MKLILTKIILIHSAKILFYNIPKQDLAPAHTAKSTKSWLNDHVVGVLDWPANSPDLNPIENLWGIVKRKMRNKSTKNADELKATVKETWASIPPQQCHKLITSMPRPIEAVIKAKGAPTKTSINFFSNLSNSSSSVGSDHTGQPSLPTCISEPWPPMTLSPIHHCYPSLDHF